MNAKSPKARSKPQASRRFWRCAPDEGRAGGGVQRRTRAERERNVGSRRPSPAAPTAAPMLGQRVRAPPVGRCPERHVRWRPRAQARESVRKRPSRRLAGGPAPRRRSSASPPITPPCARSGHGSKSQTGGGPPLGRAAAAYVHDRATTCTPVGPWSGLAGDTSHLRPAAPCCCCPARSPGQRRPRREWRAPRSRARCQRSCAWNPPGFC
jgi:hypothetical protein